jgi:hypothetical protein
MAWNGKAWQGREDARALRECRRRRWPWWPWWWPATIDTHLGRRHDLSPVPPIVGQQGLGPHNAVRAVGYTQGHGHTRATHVVYSELAPGRTPKLRGGTGGCGRVKSDASLPRFLGHHHGARVVLLHGLLLKGGVHSACQQHVVHQELRAQRQREDGWQGVGPNPTVTGNLKSQTVCTPCEGKRGGGGGVTWQRVRVTKLGESRSPS